MLTPEYLLKVSEGAEDIAEQLHQEIINQIVKRIMTRLDRGDGYILTAYDKWQIQVLEDAGFLLEDIKKEIANKTKLMQTEIAEAMEDAGVKAISYDNAIYEAAGISTTPLDMSPHLIRLMQRNYEKTLGEMQNFTGTLANAAQKLFIQECDKAYNLVTSGAMSYTQAVKEAVETIASDGVTVYYPSGHTDTIETATLRAVRTGVAQATAEITNKRMEEYDWDIILVSSHLGARVTDNEDFTNHYWWQGKFYSKSGKDKRFPPFSVCGMGHVQGLCGANCRHSYGPGDGKFNPYRQYDSEENRKAYETEQRQRALERRIRKTKREVMTVKNSRDNAQTEATRAEMDREYQRKSALLQKQNKAYNDYCAENNLKKRADRIAIAKWDRQQAAQARGAAKRYQNSQEAIHAGLDIKNNAVENGAKSGIINNRIPLIKEEIYQKVRPQEAGEFRKESGVCSAADYRQINSHKKPDGSKGGYVRSHQAWQFNETLRTAGENGLDKDDTKTLEAIRNACKSNILKRNVILDRYVNSDYLSEYDGTFNRYCNDLVSQAASFAKENLIGAEKTETAIVSASYADNVLTDRDIHIKLYCDEGTHLFVTQNKRESEVLFHDGLTYQFFDVGTEEYTSGLLATKRYRLLLKAYVKYGGLPQ